MPLISAKRRQNFESQSVVKAIHLLKPSGLSEFLPLFLDHLAEQARSVEDQALVLELTQKVAPGKVVPIARTLSRKHDVMLRIAYPQITLPDNILGERLKKVGRGFVFPIIRKESSFLSQEVSEKNAIGMMQMLPETAKDLAKKNNLSLPKDVAAHLKNPVANIKLGCLYLEELLELYDNSLVLVAAAYNAGPGRVNKWLETYGDPRKEDVDQDAWIEMIPYGETRNYVHRIMEGYAIYKANLFASSSSMVHIGTPPIQKAVAPKASEVRKVVSHSKDSVDQKNLKKNSLKSPLKSSKIPQKSVKTLAKEPPQKEPRKKQSSQSPK